MGDQEFVDVHSVPAVVDSAMTDPVVVTGEETYKVAVAAAEHEGVGNEDGNGDTSVAVVEEQVAVEEMPGMYYVPLFLWEGKWGLVREDTKLFAVCF
jgi:hypothetical protein